MKLKLAVVATIVLSLAACGSSSNTATTGTTTPATGATTAAGAATTKAGDDSTGSTEKADDSGSATTASKAAADSTVAAKAPASGSCAGIKSFILSGGMASAFSNLGKTGQTTDLSKAYEPVIAAYKALKDAAPSSLKGDFDTLIGALQKFETVLAKYNGDFTKLATDTQAMSDLEVISNPAVEAAGTRIEDYLKTSCGV